MKLSNEVICACFKDKEIKKDAKEAWYPQNSFLNKINERLDEFII